MKDIKVFWKSMCEFVKFKFNGGTNTWDFIKKKNHIKAVMDESYNKWKARAEVTKAKTLGDFPLSKARQAKEMSKSNV